MTKLFHHRFARNAALAAGLLTLLVSLPASRNLSSFELRAQQTSRRKSTAPKTAAAKQVPDAPMPFHVGESLNYRVSWTAFADAADFQLSVVERRNLFGWGTWHFRASAHTVGPVRSLFEIDDQFDSYTDAVSLASRQYEVYLSELGRKQNQVIHMVAAGETARTSGPSVAVLPGTRDPLGALYVLRGVDWKTTPEVRAPVYDGHDVYEIRAKLESPAETISIAAGKFSCSRISIAVFQNQKQVSGISFFIWFANDSARAPVQIQAVLPFGNLHVELTSSSQ
jgi:Protein of unknown function (DUF3108)